MKTLAVFAAILAVSYGAAIRDSSLKDDLLELSALIPSQEFEDLSKYYWENDEEFRNVINSEYLSQLNDMFTSQPEFLKFVEWVSDHMSAGYPEYTKQIDLKLHNNYKPGWKGYLEAYIAIIPTEKVANFVEKKVAEGGVFAEFWSRLQGLRPTYERVIRLPEFTKTLKDLEAIGFDGQQYDGFVRDILGWH